MRTVVTAVLIAVAVSCFWGAGTLHTPLIALREEAGINQAEPLENAPPLLAFTTVALGGFRGLLADVLWLRASYLQDEGKYFELIQLANWITKLEPHCTEIWAYHAWNMAYNVSAMMSDERDRWRWVRNGISLLRDEGIKYNVGDPQLYFELGWLFQNKIGHTMDRSNMYYKHQWAAEMTELFGGPGPDYGAIAASPEKLRQLRDEYKLDPETMQMIDATYGPLDWRLPESHAAYWAFRGRQRAGPEGSLVCERMIFQSMVMSFLQGRLVFRPEKDVFLTSPNIDILPSVIRAFEHAMATHPHKSVKAAFMSFLHEAVLLLYAFNRQSEAQATLALLHKEFPAVDAPSDLEQFVSKNIAGAMGRATKVRMLAFVEGFLFQGLVWTATGEPGKAAGAVALAKRYYDGYTRSRSRENLARLAIPDMAEIREQAYRRATSELPPGMREGLPAVEQWVREGGRE